MELRSICNRIAIVDRGQIVGILPSTAEPTEFGLLILGKKFETEKVCTNERKD